MTQATGGSAILSNTAGGTYTSLTGPVFTGIDDNDLDASGTITLVAPSGFQFDTGGVAPTVLVTCTNSCGGSSNNVNNLASGDTISVTVSAGTLTITITDDVDGGGTTTNSLTWQNVRVRPTAATPLASGNLTKGGTAALNDITGGDNLGTLTEVGVATVTPATGGGAISASTAGGAYTTLTGPVITESDAGAILTGTIVLNAPSGFQFDTGGVAPTVLVTRVAGTSNGTGDTNCNINNVLSGTSVAITGRTASTITFTVSDESRNGNPGSCNGIRNSLTWQNVRVRPTAAAPLASGNITKSGSATVYGVGGSDNFGTLTEVAAPSTITVNATVTNDNGGTKAVADFTYQVDATTVTSGASNSFSTGAHTVSVTGTTGYTVTIGGDCAADGSVSLAAGNNKICSVTLNDIAPKLTVTKVVTNDNGGSKAVGDFTLKIDAATVTSGVQNTLSAGAHTVSEVADAGYSASFSGDCAADGSITLAPGDVKACTITNNDVSAPLTVTANFVNDDGGTKGVADVTLKVDASTVTSGVAANFDAGTHVVTGTALAGYTQTISGDCAADGSITLNNGVASSCTITYDDIAPKLTVTKVVTNDNGGTKVATDFVLKVDGGIVTTGVEYAYDSGVHTVSETADVGYATTYGGDCAADGTITLELGDVKSCTITNDDIAPKLTITKIVVNDHGGTKAVADFPLFLDTAPVTSGVENTTAIGAHNVSETSDTATYSRVIGGDCAADGSITLALGDVKSCTITNDDIQPQLTLVVHVVTDDGGTAVASDFSVNTTGTNVSVPTVTGNEAGQTITLNAGSFGTSLTVPALLAGKYSLLFSGDCVGTLLPGDVKTCTYTLNDIAPKLTVTKVVVNDNGGTVINTSVPLFIDATVVTSGVQATTTIGAHVVSETNPSGYASIIAGDCAADGSITLGLGDVKSCVITNNDIPASLTIIKTVVNDNGGTKTAADFTMTVTGNNPSLASFAGNAVGTTISIDAGSYSVGEVADSGYTATLSADCTGSLLPGESKTCTITNDDVAPKLTVTKVVVNTHGGTKNSTDFPLFVDGNPVSTGIETTLPTAGTYVVTETSDPGYSSAFSGDCDVMGSITLLPGDVKTCTITNTDDVAPHLVVNKIVVNDNGGTKTVLDFELSLRVDGLLIAMGVPTVLPTGSHTVSEVTDAGYVPSFSGDCAADGSITLAPGEFKTCTITNNDVPPAPVIEPTDSGRNGGHRGEDSNQLLGKMRAIALRSGLGGDTAPAGFGGSNDVPLSTAELNVLCSVQRTFSAQTPIDLIRLIASTLGTFMSRDADFIAEKMLDPATCERINASLKPSATVAEVILKPVPLTIDGYPVSNNDTWNKCVRGNATLTDIRNNKDIIVSRMSGKTFAKSCDAYRTSGTNEWKHPDDPFLTLTIVPNGKNAPKVTANTGYLVIPATKTASR